MSNKKKERYWYFGKNLPKTDLSRSPIKGEPNSNIDFYETKNGKFHRRRKIGYDGRAYVDLDVADITHKEDHANDYLSDGRRCVPRILTKKEKKELNKAKKKRRFWK